jgi:hypothetical protein
VASPAGKEFSMKAPAPLRAALKLAGQITACTVLLLTLIGCAAQKPLRFAPKNISRIQYDPQSCRQMPDGKFRCSDVVFTVTAINVGPAAE